MKKWLNYHFQILLFLYCILLATSTNAQSINNVRISPSTSHLCPGSSYNVLFDTASVGLATFEVQLSDQNGFFTTPSQTFPSTATSINISIAFTAVVSNIYAIRVIRTLPSTIISSDTLKNLSITRPTPSFTFNNNNTCAGNNIVFTNGSTGATPLTCSYNFGVTAGAPLVANTCNPTVQFFPPAGGGTYSYTTTLTVTDVYQCAKSFASTVSVKQAPDPVLTDSNLFASPIFSNCQGNPSLSNSSFRLTVNNASVNQSLISNYFLNWGISSTITLPNTLTTTSFVYPNLGVYNISFTANNTNGCSATRIYKAINQSNPAIGILGPQSGSTQGCSPRTFPFYLRQYLSNSVGTYYVWDFGDGSPNVRWDTVLTDTIYHTFTESSCGKPGNEFVVKVTAYNFCDSTSATVNNIKIWTKPKSNFTISPDTVICKNQNITLVNTTKKGKYASSCDSTTIYSWLFPGGSPSTSTLQTPPVITYTTEGLYSITLISSNPCGSDTFVKSICVQPIPVPNFSMLVNPISRCKNATIDLTNLSNTLTSCGRTTYAWSVFDSITNAILLPGTRFTFITPGTASSINTSINFIQVGVYKIRLIVTNTCGTYSKDTFITIKDKPIVSLPAAKSYCDEQTLAFNSSNPFHNPIYNANFGTITAYNWTISPIGYSFTSGNTSSQYPIIFFSNNTTSPIIYTVTLTATNECGTSSAATQSITINPKPTVSNSGVTQILCGTLSTNMTANTALVGIGSWVLVSGPSGSIINQINNPNTLISGLNSSGNPSIYVYSWTISQTGCTPSISYDTIKVYPATNPGTISANNIVCAGNNSGVLNLTGNAGNVLRWEMSTSPFTTWSPLSNTSTTNSYLNLMQTTWYRVVVQSGGVCSSANSGAVIITVDSVTLAGNLNGADTVCAGINSGSIILNNKRGQIQNWQYSNALPSWSNIVANNNPFTYNNLSQNTWYRVIVKNGVCPAAFSDSVKIQVDLVPSAAIAPNRIVCATSLTIGLNDSLIANTFLIGSGQWTYLSGPNLPSIISPINRISLINNLAIGTHFIQWKVSNGKCPSNLDTMSLTVLPPLQSSISSDQTICSGQTPALLIGSSNIGGNGTYNYQWQISLNGSTYSDIIGATTSNYQPSPLLVNTWFKRKVSSGPCTIISNAILITVQPGIASNTIFPNASICIGTSSPLITGSTPSGGDGNYHYNWQKFSGGLWVNLTIGDTLPSYNPGILPFTAIYRRVVTSGFCNGPQGLISNYDTITINPLPIANAGIDYTKCSNQPKYFLGGTPANGTWTGPYIVGDSLNPSTTPIGTYTLIYTYVNANNCLNRDTVQLSIIVPPSVNAGSDFTICENAPSMQLIGFNPTTGGVWSGPGVNPTGLFNPSIAGSGVFNLIYSFIAGSGCNGYDTLIVTVNPKPNTNFTLATQKCPNDTFNLLAITNPLANISTYLWSVNNTGSFSNTILSGYTASSALGIFPENKTIADVTYSIKLLTISNANCRDSITKTSVLRRRPLAQFTTGANINCGPANYTILNGTSNVLSSFIWNSNPSSSVNINTNTSINPLIVFPINNSATLITYSIQLIATRNDGTLGCRDTVLSTINVYPKPQAIINLSPAASGCSPLLVNFTNGSIPKNGEAIGSMNFLWSFSNFANDTARNQVKTYTNTGVIDSIRTIRLISTTQWGCKDTANTITNVYPFPKANFTAINYTSCAPFIIDSNVVTLFQYPVANDNYNWQILDKNLNVISNTFGTTAPIKILANPNDTVFYRLITSNVHGCKPDTILRLFRTIDNPKANFSLSDSVGCHPLNIHFTNTSTPGVALSWNFGNGQISISDTTSIVFINNSKTIDSVYNASLIITAGSTGCKDTLNKQIRVYPRPQAINSFVTPKCAPSIISSNNTSVFKPTTATYLWSIQSPITTLASISNNQAFNPNFSFPDNQSAGDTTYTIKLRVTSVNGCFHDTTNSITINARPFAIFTAPQTNCGPANITVINTTSNVSSNWLWNVNPTATITTITNQNPQISFTQNNSNDSIIYRIKLIATRTGTNCLDSTFRTVTIFPRPQSLFSIINQDSCGPRQVNFINTSNPKNGEGVNTMNFQWSLLGTANINFNANGLFNNSLLNDSIYPIRLIATSKHGCADSSISNVTVRPNAKAIYTRTIGTACAPFFISASNIVAQAFVNANSNYLWYANGLLIGSGITFPGATILNQADSVCIKLKAISKNSCKNDSVEMWFYTIENPKPKFTAVDSVTCPGVLVHFQNNSTPLNGLNYRWEFGNNLSTSNLKNPNFTFYNYSVLDTLVSVKLVTIAGGTGCLDSISKIIRIKPLPNPDFILSDSFLCYPKKLVVNNNSSQTPPIISNSYHWSINPIGTIILNDTSNSQTTIAFDDNQSGSNRFYQIKLISTSDFGCIDSTVKSIRVPSRPIANYTMGSDSACGPFQTLTNNSSLFANTYNWSNLIPGPIILNPSANNTTLQFQKHYGLVDSFYFIRLIAISIDGCQDTLVKPVKIFPLPVSNYISDLDTGCSPFPVAFFNHSILRKPASYLYNFGDGSNLNTLFDTISKTFIGSVFQDTTYMVSLIATSSNGCKDTITKPIYVLSGADANIYLTDTLICSNATSPTKLRIDNHSFGSVDTFYWDFGDGNLLTTTKDTSIFKPYPFEGTYRITLKAVNTCRTSYDTALVTVQVPPNVNFTKTDSVGCSPLDVTFTNHSTNVYHAVFNWNFGNGNTSSNYDAPKQTYLQSLTTDTFYYVKLNVANVCGNYPMHDTVRVLPKPTAIFLSNTLLGCSPLEIYLSNFSVGVPQNVKWYFGNGDSSMRFNLDYPFKPILYRTLDTITIFTIKLIVSNICGSDTMTKYLTVLPNTVKSFFSSSAQNGCQSLTVNFKDLSYGGANISWNFGDGGTSSDSSPVHTFSTPGTYKVRQFVNNNCSYDTSSVIIYVYPKPRFTIGKGAGNICVNQPVQFVSNLQDSGYIVWHFGDGDSSIAYNPTHVYTTPGKKVFTASLTSNYNTCKTVQIDSLIVNAIPIISIAADTNRGCLNHYFNLTAISNGNHYYSWDFGDSNFAITKDVLYKFKKPGTYTLKLVATSILGCKDSAFKQIEVYPIPTAQFDYTPKDTCSGPVWVNFTNQSTGANSFAWDFGNGNTSTSTNGLSYYAGIGKFKIQLTAENTYFCYDTITHDFEIFYKPEPDFDFDVKVGCTPLTVKFTNKSKYSKTYLWYFGDGTTSILENPEHIYYKGGNYNVSLVAFAGKVCSDSFQTIKTIVVYPKPVPSFTHDLETIQKPYRKVNFTSTSINGNKFEWDFGDGNLGSGEITSHRYGDADSGCFPIILRAMSINNCDSTISDTICLPGYWKGLYVPNAFTPDLGVGGPNEFLPIGIELKQFHIKVFSQWGILVWESTSLDELGRPNEAWKGFDLNNNPCPQGVYIWVVTKAIFTDDKPWKGMTDGNENNYGLQARPGNVTLIR